MVRVFKDLENDNVINSVMEWRGILYIVCKGRIFWRVGSLTEIWIKRMICEKAHLYRGFFKQKQEVKNSEKKNCHYICIQNIFS